MKTAHIRHRDIYCTEEEWTQPFDYVEGGSAFKSLAEASAPVVAELGAAVEIDPATESPIETLLGAALKLALPPGHILVPQYPLARFRYDFAILNARYQLLALIECDGRDYHSAPDQIANDRLKDAAAERAGAAMIRFPGQRITRARADCVDDVLRILRGR